MSELRWKVLPAAPPHLLAGGDYPPLLVQLLYNRGITDPAAFDGFLAADERWSADPLLLPEMDKAVVRILRALLRGEVIGIYGDFDADGITATVLLTDGLSSLGARAVPYIPERLEEGHGLTRAGVERLRQQGAELIISVDCGITAWDEVQRAQSEGIDIIITDHHAVTAPIPPAVASIDPKRPDSSYPFVELAGVGVAYKLVQALGHATGHAGLAGQLFDLVALGTVADLVPLLGENRYLVKRGLEALRRTHRLGLQELMLGAGLLPEQVNSDVISFALAPRLNATGRVDHAITSYELLTAESTERARELARWVEAKNGERQRLTAKVLSKIKAELPPGGPEEPLVMLGGYDYPAGVVGVVAGKLVDEFYRPALVLELGPELSRGSARSIPEFDITAALTLCQDLLIRFGGHAQAAGCSLMTANVEKLRSRLLAIAREELADVDLRPAVAIDAEMPLSALAGDTFQTIQRLAPFGRGNPAPAFLSRRVEVVDSSTAGSGGEHLKLKLRDGGVIWDAIGFDLGERDVSPYLDVVYTLEAETWSGRGLLRLNVIDFRQVQ